MTQNDVQKPKSVIRLIVDKLFCLHDMKFAESVTHYNAKGEIIQRHVLHICTKCGRSSKTTLG